MCQELAGSRDENTQGTSRTEVVWKQVQAVHTLGEDTISVVAHTFLVRSDVSCCIAVK